MRAEVLTSPRGVAYFYVTEAADLPRIADKVRQSKVIGLDIETAAAGAFLSDSRAALDPYKGQIRLVQISTRDDVFVIDLFQTKTLGKVLDAIVSEDVIKIIQNAKFEQKWFAFHFEADLWPIFDTFRASAIINNGRRMGHNLWDVMARELEEDFFAVGDDKGASGWGGVLTRDQLDYAADDVTQLHEIRLSQKAKLKELGLNGTALAEFGAVLPESRCELAGFYLDGDSWVDLAVENKKKMESVRDTLMKQLPNPKKQLMLLGVEPPRKKSRSTHNVFNLDSNDDILMSLQMMGLRRKVKDPKTGVSEYIAIDSTAEIVLAMFAAKHPVIRNLFAYREHGMAIKTFGAKWLDYIHPVTGRIHTSYWPFTGAGRYSSKSPNLQQIPRGKAFRSCFRAAPGYVFVAADYSGIEMRIAAEVARDSALANVFRKGMDAHTYTAAILNGLTYEEVANGVKLEKAAKKNGKYSLMRQQSKAVNFGLLYGMGATKLVLYAMANYGVSLTLKQAEQFRNKFFEAYPGLKRWHGLAYRDGQRMGYTCTLNGRRRYLDPDKSYSEWFNTPVQGTGADALKKSLRRVCLDLQAAVGDAARIVHHVHDEILVEVKDDPDTIAKVKEILEVGMIESMQTMLKHVPVEVEAAVGKNWAEVH